MKTFEQWKDEHGIHQGYPDHEMIYNGGCIEGLASKTAKLAAMTAAKNKAVEALKSRRELLADCQFPRSYDQTKDEVLIKLDALIAELEEVK